MARKSRNVCLVPPWWTQEEIQSRTCGDGSHKHVPRAEVAILLDWKEADWVPGLVDKVLRIKRVAKALRDKSAKLGEYLTRRVKQERAAIRHGRPSTAPWATVLEESMHIKGTEPNGETKRPEKGVPRKAIRDGKYLGGGRYQERSARFVPRGKTKGF